jgi:hypothetical protein
MKSRFTRFCVLAFLFMPAFQSGCSKKERSVEYRESTLGNPRAPISNEVLFAVCGVINRCHSQVTLTDCQGGVLRTSGFAAPLGLTTSLDTMESILQAEFDGALVGSQAAGNNCYGQINRLDCSDGAVQGAYNPLLANPFAAAPGLIPSASCSQVFAPASYANVIVADNPLGYWRMGESVGATIAYDVMGIQNGSYVSGTGFALGLPGALVGSTDTAAQFSDSGQGRIELTLPAINTASGTFISVEFWMKWSGSAVNSMPFGFQGYNLWLTGGNQLGFNTGNGDSYGISGAAVGALANSWVHVVAIMKNMALSSDMADNELYLNSVLQTSSQTGAPLAKGATSSLRVSSWAQDVLYPFDGALDEFAVYNYGLSQAQITRHYQNGLGNFP